MCAYFLVVAVGGRTTWERLRVPVEDPSFLDLRSLTSAWECERIGIDVLPVNPCDPRARPANYPSIWLLPAPLGLGDSATVPLGVGLAVLFLVSAIAVPGPLTPRGGALYGIALCSPAVMFGVERGNPDLFVFCLLAAALLALGRGTALRIFGGALLVLATILKFYPVFAWGMLVRRSVAITAALFAAVGAYVALTIDEVRTILDVVPREILFSYGAGVLADGLVEALDLRGVDATVLSVVVVLAGGLCALLVGARWRRAQATFPRGRGLDAFWAGAGIYVGSYAVMHNYDYRLLFLLFVIPLLLRTQTVEGGALPLAPCGLALVMASLLLAARPTEDLAAEEAVNWVLFVYLGAALIATSRPLRAGSSTATDAVVRGRSGRGECTRPGSCE